MPVSVLPEQWPVFAIHVGGAGGEPVVGVIDDPFQLSFVSTTLLSAIWNALLLRISTWYFDTAVNPVEIFAWLLLTSR